MGQMAEMQATSTMMDAGGGSYHGVLTLPMAGTWNLKLGVTSSDGRSGSGSLEVTTGSGIVVKSAHAAKGIAYYTCSMHPSVRSKIPGSCPICGMNLTPVTTVEIDTGVIFADAQRRQLIGVTTGKVERKDTAMVIRAEGMVGYAEPRLSEITLRYPVWIGQVFASSLGIEVKKNQPLFTISSPDLLAAENEYLQGLRLGHDDIALRQATRSRLSLWGLSESQIDSLAMVTSPPPYIAILAPSDGVVIDKEILPGSAVDAGKLLLRIADMSELWVESALYEYEESAVKVGMPVDVMMTAFPGDHWQGKVGFVYPYLDDQTRTTRVRVILANADHRLKPGMYATAHIHIPLGVRVVVPVDAVIHAGETSLVFVDLGDGKLKPQHVTTGQLTEDGIEILSGVNPGDTVVTKATFLLAAESRLKSGTASW